MTSRPWLLAPFVVLAVALPAIADDTHAPTDAGRPDAGAADAGAADSGADAAVPLAAFPDGAYRLADPAAADAAVDAAIETAIRTLHPSMREAFRQQLRATLRFPRRLVVAREPARAHVTWDATLLESSLDGTEAGQRGPEGRSITVAMRRIDAGLELAQRTPNFTRTDRLGGSAGGLSVTAVLRSRLMRSPIEVAVTYVVAAP